MTWTVKHYGDDAPLISNDGEIRMLAKGATPGEADEIAAALNAHLSDEEPATPDTYTITKRCGDQEVVYSAPAADEVVWMAAQNVEVREDQAESLYRSQEQRVFFTDSEGKRQEVNPPSAPEDFLRYQVEERNKELERIAHERDAWIQTSAEYAHNLDYYRCIVDRCARAIGPEAFTCDDGSLSERPLRDKVAELVEKMCTEPAKPALPDMLTMRSAFRTLESGAGAYAMVFKFGALNDMHAADAEWRTLRNVIETQK